MRRTEKRALFIVDFFSDIKRAHRPEYDSFSQSLEICMRKIESSMKPELEKIAENKAINFRLVCCCFHI